MENKGAKSRTIRLEVVPEEIEFESQRKHRKVSEWLYKRYLLREGSPRLKKNKYSFQHVFRNPTYFNFTNFP